jgi:methionyl-tRNA formyltransferase
MNIVFMGTPDFAVETLRLLYDSEHNVQAVFTQPDKPKGRGYKLIPPPVKKLSEQYGTAVYQPLSLKKDADEYIDILKNLVPDCIVVAAYGKILPKSVLDIPKYGCVNVHASLLPKYRGAAPIQRAVFNGDKETGVTTMLMGEGLDTGDMLLKATVEIGENETSAELFDRLAKIGGELLIETLTKLERGEITPEPQEESQATYAAMITKDMCPIDFNQSVRKVHKQICGLSDSPTAYAYLDGKRLKVYHSEIVSNEKADALCGEFVGKKQFDVACADGVIRFVEIQAEGGKRMDAKAYLNGKPVKEKTILTTSL